MRVEREDVSESVGFINVPLPPPHPPLTLCLQISSCILREAVVTEVATLACKACYAALLLRHARDEKF